MPDLQNARVAVYLDFDNIVMSWYDRVHGRNSYSRDRQRIADNPADPEIAERLSAATIDVGAIIDFAASFGTLVLTRAYADWSAPVNAIYRSQLVARAVDLVQLFPAAAYAKNGADIRLAVDAVEDMFRLPDLTHVVIVAGDSDYVPLAQRCKRLGRYVVGVGVAGSTAKSLAAACDEFEAYDSLPGVPRFSREPAKAVKAPEKALEKAPAKAKAASTRGTKAKETGTAAAAASAPRSGGRRGAGKATDAAAQEAVAPEVVTSEAPTVTAPADDTTVATPPPSAPEIEAALNEALETAAPPKRTNRRASSKTVAASVEPAAPEPPQPVEEPAEDPQETATRLLERALRLGHDKNDDSEWLHSSAVKTHMRRMDPSFSEKALGYRSFNDFVKARESIAELEETGHERLVRLRE
ncbi:hypothetical protein GCM10025760_17820 [Microbacterium yannicii]|uniref:HTH OST-type domain-containing protein n=1 Tax=Microbacterium yannicii TaxID=671622 RepID=A0ABP9M9I2_9MICO|nr:NYN domain-containing protein [Microbacterium yannicii]MCO5951351.1 NYN domain-containing protein [Microbacterium yannicii]